MVNQVEQVKQVNQAKQVRAKWCQVVSIYVTIWPRDVSYKNAYIVIKDWCDLKKWGWC